MDPTHAVGPNDTGPTAVPGDRLSRVSEGETARRYDRQRRQRLLILLGATFGGTIGVLFVVILILLVVTRQFSTSAVTELVGVALNALIYAAVILLARSERVEWASALFAVGAGIVPNINILAASATGGANPFDVVFLMGAIVIVSLAGQPWMVFSTALLSSLTTVYMVELAPLPATTAAQRALHVYLVSTGGGSLAVLFVAYWAMALLLLAQWRSYQHLLLELADVRVQVERARQLDALKDQFIHSVNHELRTPIMTMLGYIDLLMLPDNRRSTEKVDRYLQRAERAGQALRRLLAGILDTRRLNTGSEVLSPERVDVMDAVEEAIPLIYADSPQGTNLERALRMHVSPALCVWAEPLMFQQILINLLGNAVKYSDPGTPIDITARATSDGDGHAPSQGWFRRSAQPQTPMIEVAVRDYGLGIPPQHQPLLFQRFMRLPRELDSNVMGTGLGLYLCKTLVDKLGGSIRVESSGIPGEGSTFIVHLPVPPEAGESAVAGETPVSVAE